MTSPAILVVEDNPLNFELVHDLLEVSGFVVHHAATAEQALQLARELQPDLILMDLSLPGMDGLCATRQLKHDAATRHLPVIALTAHAMKGDDQLAAEAGCDGYLTKPIDTRTFVQRVQHFLASATCGRPESITATLTGLTYAN